MTTKPVADKTEAQKAADDSSTDVGTTPTAAAEEVKAYATGDDLKIPVLAEADIVTITGKRLRVRGLSRYEAGSLPDADNPGYDAKMIHMALLQPSGLSIADIEAWRRAAPTRELVEVMGKITDLSGMGADAGKAAYKSIRGERDS